MWCVVCVCVWCVVCVCVCRKVVGEEVENAYQQIVELVVTNETRNVAKTSIE